MRRRLPAVLHERQFRLLYGAQLSSLLGDGLVPVALAFAVLDLTGNAGDLGLVLAARTVPLVLLLLAGGVIADRYSRRGVMVVADLTRVATQGLTAVLLISGDAEIWHLAVLQAAGGAASALFLPATTGLLAEVVRDEHLQQANSLKGFAESVGLVAGPAIAGILVATAGAGWAMAVDAATFAVSAVFLLRVPDIIAPAASAGRSFLRDLRDGWGEFRSRTWVWVGVSGAAIGNLLGAAYMVLGPAFAAKELDGASSWAAIATATGIGAVIGTVAVMRTQPRRPVLVAYLTIILFAGPPLGLAAGLPLAAVIVLALGGGSSIIVFNALWETTIQREIPRESLSRVVSYDWLGSMALSPVGSAVGGAVGAAAGLRPSLLVVGILLVASPLLVLSVPAVRAAGST